MSRNLMICGNSNKSLVLNESEKDGGRYVLEGVFATLGKKNRNDRIYGKEEYLKHLQYLRDDIKKGESLLGELDHPEDRFEVKIKEASHRIIDLWYDEQNNNIMGKIELLNTPNGKIAQSLVDQGIPLHISSRAAGSVNADNTVNIQQIYTYDLVAKPGFAEAVLHRVNESADANNYTEEARNFLTESEVKQSHNAAPQFGFLNEDISITEIPSEIKLRSEAMKIQEEENMNINDCDNNPVKEDEIVEKKDDDQTTDDTGASDDNNDSNSDDDSENNDENNADEDNKEDDIEILSIEVETTGDDDEEDDIEITDVDSDDENKDDENSDDENSDENSDDENSDENKEDKTDECDGATSECGDACKSEGEDKKGDDEEPKHDPKKEMILDGGPAERRSKFEDKFSEFMDAHKKKNEEKQANESKTITMYPTSALLTESNFAAFMGLDESKKNKVMSFLRDKNYVTAQAINENWKNGIDYEPEQEVWLKYAPENYRELYESAPEEVKTSIKNTATYLLFENQRDVNNFWENTGLMERSKRNLIHESFINNLPKIDEGVKQTELPYGNEFINAITEMACGYNS